MDKKYLEELKYLSEAAISLGFCLSKIELDEDDYKTLIKKNKEDIQVMTNILNKHNG